jgi:hypothetical protein
MRNIVVFNKEKYQVGRRRRRRHLPIDNILTRNFSESVQPQAAFDPTKCNTCWTPNICRLYILRNFLGTKKNGNDFRIGKNKQYFTTK